MDSQVAIYLFFLFVLNRLFSGMRNGGEYKGNTSITLLGVLGLLVTAITIAAVTIGSKGWVFVPQMWQGILVITGCVVACLIHVFAVNWNDIYSDGKWYTPYMQDIHLLTLSESSILSGVMLLAGWEGVVAVVCSVYPAVYLQKLIINTITGQRPHFDGTDDPTGRTFGLPSIGIKVPRTTQNKRLVYSIISVLVLFILSAIL